MNKLFIGILLLILFFNSNLFGQALTDSTIMMTAFWENDDTVIYEFSEREDKLSKGKKTIQTTNYDVTMSIIDSTSSNYKVEWEYSNYNRDYEMSQFEKDLMEICGDIPVQFITNEFGGFESIENWEVMGRIADESFDKWLSDKKELPDSISSKIKTMVTSLFSSQEQVNFFARDLKFFHYLYGANLDRNKPYEGIKYYSNPFLQIAMPGKEKVTVQTVDEQNWIAKIKVTSGISGKEAKSLMVDFTKKNMDKLGITDESEIKLEDMPEFSAREELEIIYDIETGYILKGKYNKLTRLNSDYKNTTYKFNLKK